MDFVFEGIDVAMKSHQRKCSACAQASFEHVPPRDVSPALKCPGQEVSSDVSRKGVGLVWQT